MAFKQSYLSSQNPYIELMVPGQPCRKCNGWQHRTFLPAVVFHRGNQSVVQYSLITHPCYLTWKFSASCFKIFLYKTWGKPVLKTLRMEYRFLKIFRHLLSFNFKKYLALVALWPTSANRGIHQKTSIFPHNCGPLYNHIFLWDSVHTSDVLQHSVALLVEFSVCFAGSTNWLHDKYFMEYDSPREWSKLLIVLVHLHKTYFDRARYKAMYLGTMTTCKT